MDEQEITDVYLYIVTANPTGMHDYEAGKEEFYENIETVLVKDSDKDGQTEEAKLSNKLVLYMGALEKSDTTKMRQYKSEYKDILITNYINQLVHTEGYSQYGESGESILAALSNDEKLELIKYFDELADEDFDNMLEMVI